MMFTMSDLLEERPPGRRVDPRLLDPEFLKLQEDTAQPAGDGKARAEENAATVHARIDSTNQNLESLKHGSTDRDALREQVRVLLAERKAWAAYRYDLQTSDPELTARLRAKAEEATRPADKALTATEKKL